MKSLNLFITLFCLSILLFSCEQKETESIIETHTNDTALMTFDHLSDEEQQALYDEITANEGLSEEEMELRGCNHTANNILNYSAAPVRMLENVRFRNKSEDSNDAEAGDPLWLYFSCQPNFFLSGQEFRVSSTEFIIVSSRSEAEENNPEARKCVSAGKELTGDVDNTCYRATTYCIGQNSSGQGYSAVISRHNYRRSGNGYANVNWTSWKRVQRNIWDGNNAPDCW